VKVTGIQLRMSKSLLMTDIKKNVKIWKLLFGLEFKNEA
jgi:hypothetical protein